MFFLLVVMPFVERHESVEWSRDVDLPLVINCWENVTFDGGFIDDGVRVLWSLGVITDAFVGEISACRTIYESDGDGQLVDNADESIVDCVEQILVRVLDESKIEFVRLRVSNSCPFV